MVGEGAGGSGREATAAAAAAGGKSDIQALFKLQENNQASYSSWECIGAIKSATQWKERESTASGRSRFTQAGNEMLQNLSSPAPVTT
jgi:hypothetical protein